MSLILNAKLANSNAEKRIMIAQWNEVQALRSGASLQAMKDFINNTGAMNLETNAAQTPAEAYREFDSTTKIEMVPAGEHATFSRLMQKARPVSIGRQVFEYRRSSDTDTGQSSMSGQIGVKMDHVDYSYAGTIVPIHDKAYGRNWREVEGMRADGFDATVDDARECERKLITTMDDYLWDGNANLSLKGRVWLGIKNDTTVATATIGLDLSAGASAAQDIQNEVKRIRDILRITNNCVQQLRVGVSREIMSNWERSVALTDSTFGSILSFVETLKGIAEVYEDSRLVGNELVMYWDDQQGFHPVVGMGINSYAVPRQFHNADFNFIKWAAVGFLAKTDFSNRKCAIFGS